MSTQPLSLHSLVPQPTQCVPYVFSWDGCISPYTFSVANSGPGGPNFNNTVNGLAAPNALWAVNVPGGTQFVIRVADSAGYSMNSGPYTVQNMTEPSCLSLNDTSLATTALAPLVAGETLALQTSTSSPTASATANSTSASASETSTTAPSANATSTTATSTSTSKSKPNSVSASGSEGVKAKIVIVGALALATLSQLL